MKILTVKQIILMHSMLIRSTGGIDGVRDEGMLESACIAPFQTYSESELYPSIIEKAARLV